MKNKTVKNTENTGIVPKFKALDLVIILMVIVAVLGIYFRYNLLDTLTSNKELREYTVSFSIDNVRHTTPKYFNVGDTVYYADDGEQLGVLISESDDMQNIALSVTPASEMFVQEDGTVEEVFYPNSESRVNADGRMTCTGAYSNAGGLLINGSKYLAAGQTISVKTELVSVSITITDIELVN